MAADKDGLVSGGEVVGGDEEKGPQKHSTFAKLSMTQTCLLTGNIGSDWTELSCLLLQTF